MTKTSLGLFSFLFLLLSCSEEQVIKDTNHDKSTEVRFRSTVENLTKASGTTWSQNDNIGIYMFKSGSSLDDNSIINNGENIQYVTEYGNGYFVTANTKLEYPEDGSNVDFIAYYPYKAQVNDFVYKVDVSNQNDLENIDLLYSDNLTERNINSPVGNLQFAHQLSYLTLNLKSTDGTQFTYTSATINGIKDKADFNLKDGTLTITSQETTSIPMHVTLTSTGANAEAILIPQQLNGDLSLTLKIGNKEKDITIPGFTELIAGTRHSYTVNISNCGSQLDPEATDYERWRETPVITKSQIEDDNLVYIRHYMENGMKDPVTGKALRNYCMLYDKTLKFSYWVAYPLFLDCIGTSGRTDEWAFDPSISTSWQVDLSSGFNENGYDRGHQIPSGDRTKDNQMNEPTFYYTNMTPQKAYLNQRVWANLETKVRGWASGTDTIYVVTGAIPPQTNIQYTKKGMAIPEYYFKALARKVNGTYRSIAFRFDNKDYDTSTDLWSGKMTVAELEEMTGFTFFPTLNVDKTQIDSSWN